MTDEKPDKVRFHYLKSPLYRTIHVDGAWGGPNPQGQITMSVFSERLPIPQTQVRRLDGGTVGDELPGTRVSKDGVVREVEASLVMSLRVAESLYAWLEKHIKKTTELRQADDAGGEHAVSSGEGEAG